MDNGRPLEWRPEYNEQIIAYAEQDLFLEEIAEKFKVDFTTMYRWINNEKCIGFRHAYMRARNIVLSRLKREMRNASTDKFFSARGHEFLINQMTRQAVQIEGISQGNESDKIKCVMKKLEDDGLRTEEFSNLMNGLKTAFEILNAKEALDKLERIEEKS